MARMKRPFAVLLIVALVACGGAKFVPTSSADAVLLAKPETPAEVRAAVIRALENRRFTTESEEAGRVVARLDKGDASLHVAVEYTGSQYLVRYLNSTGLMTQPGPSGTTLVEDRWVSWVKGLKARIKEELALPAKEA